MYGVPGNKIENIQALRGVAVVLVLFYHVMLHERKYGRFDLLLPDFFQVGASGVDLFFVISGFVITTVTQRQFGKGGAVKEFVWNRVTRIYPVFWFYWLLFVLAFYLFPQSMVTTSLGGAFAVARSFLLLPQDQFPILSISWTLVHELYFYLVFTFFMLLFERKHLTKLLFAFFFFMIAGNLIIASVNFGNAAWLKLITHPLTLEFIAGCLISELIYKGGARRYGLASIITGAIGLVVLSAVFLKPVYWAVPEGWARVLLFGIPSACIVYGATALEIQSGKQISKALNLIGDASYSTYLSHAMVFSVTGVFFSKITIIKTNAVLIVLMFAAAIAWGMISYFFVEKPILSFFRNAKAILFRQPSAAYSGENR